MTRSPVSVRRLVGWRVLVIGADGLLGRTLSSMLVDAGASVMGTSRRPGADAVTLDLGAPADWPSLSGYDGVFLLAGISNVARCETDPDGTHRINVEAACALAERAVANGAIVVFPSSSRVFDGQIPFVSATAAPSPRCVYGRQKAEAEQRLLRVGGCSVVRLTKCLAFGGMLETWASQFGAGHGVTAVGDRFMAPVTPAFAASAMIEALARRVCGIVHVSAADHVSFADVAHELGRVRGLSSAFVREISAAAAQLDTITLPTYASLATDTMATLLGLVPPSSREAVEYACRMRA